MGMISLTDKEMVETLREKVGVSRFGCAVANLAADRIEQLVATNEQLQAKLKTSEEIGRAFEEDAGQLRAKLTKAVNVIKNLINLAPEGDEDEWHIALDDAAEALAEIKGET